MSRADLKFQGEKKKRRGWRSIKSPRRFKYAPLLYNHFARLNICAKQSSTRVNNCVLQLMLLQSGTNPCHWLSPPILTKCWNKPWCQARQTLLGRRPRGRSLREHVVDTGGDLPILQDETGLNQSVGTVRRRIKIKKLWKTVLRLFSDPFSVPNWLTTLPSMEQWRRRRTLRIT